MIDIRQSAETIEAINAILNNRGIAEVKIEGREKASKVAVVEIKRTMKAQIPTK